MKLLCTPNGQKVQPLVAFIVFLSVADEDVVLEAWDNACHVNSSDP